MFAQLASRLRLILIPLLILVYWQIAASLGWVSSYLLPPPMAVWEAMEKLYNSGALSKHVYASLTRVLQGFVLSCVLGVLIAGCVHRFKCVNELLIAPLAFLRMIPPLAMTPLLILWLGLGDATKLTIIVMASFFPIFLNTRDGLRRVTPEQQELATSLHLSRWRYTKSILLPAAIPSIITGARLAFGYSWRALIGAELIAASSGLGYMILNAQGLQRTDVVIGGILIIGILGWLLDTIFYRTVVITLKRRFPEVAN